MKNDNNSLFKTFAHFETKHNANSKEAVVYTRVSDISQKDNMSLEQQKKSCEQYAKSKGYNIVAYFGGTYESAKTDDRKEFKKMLTYVKRKKSTAYILVYSYERFSRTGISGASIAEDLLKQYGIVTLSTSQEIDPTTPMGAFYQKMQFLWGELDNINKSNAVISKIQEILRKGYWTWKLPRGYTNRNLHGKAVEQDVIINEEGKLLQKVVKWKIKYHKTDTQCIEKLKDWGMKMDVRRFANILKNPFYCGIIVNKLIPNEVIEAKHPAIISKKDFAYINNIKQEQRNHPTLHRFDNENLPLKRFLRCSKCNIPMTGFEVKVKGLFYYKCRTKKCSNTLGAKKLHQVIENTLSLFHIPKEEKEVFKDQMMITYMELTKDHVQEQAPLKKTLNELNARLETIEERFVIGEISSEQYEKYRAKFTTEKEALENKIENLEISSSNLENAIEYVVDFCEKPAFLWSEGTLEEKKQFQSFVFPEGILYNKEIDRVQTPRINSFFALSGQYDHNLKQNKSGENISFDVLPALVTPEGFKPPTLRAEI